MVSELEALTQGTDFEVRRVLLKLLNRKAKIEAELEGNTLSVTRRGQLSGVMADLDSQLQQYRFDGFIS